jgi:cyclic pyranopterin phosphate synthase
MSLSHVDAKDRPTMVDVGDKRVTERHAVARAVVRFPMALQAELDAGGELHTKKGPVIDTAIIAGVMAAKKTHELIPFCHQLPLENCKFEFDWPNESTLEIRCSVRATHKTGVEMEALTGASVAALAVYDMCKALSHEIEITDICLLAKCGGKADFSRGLP